MMDAALAAVSAVALFEALRHVVTCDDLLRLRSMTRLSVAVAIVAAPMGYAPFLAAILAIAICAHRPDLQDQPALSSLLLIATPACGLCGAIAFAHGWDWPLAASPPLGPVGGIAVILGFVFALTAQPALGLGWRVRFVATVASGFSFVAAVWYFTGGDARHLVVAVPSFLGALVLAVRQSDAAALKRLAAGSAAALSAPLLVFAAHAGPWTQAAGDELLIVRAPLQSGGDGAYGVQTYSEAGLSDDVTFVVSGFQEMSRRDSRAGGSAGLRVALWREDGWIVSGESSAGVEPFSLNRGTADWERHVQAEVKGMAGWSGVLDSAPVYANAEIGWRFRPEEFGDAAVLAVNAGIDLTTDVQANVHASVELNRGEDRVFGQASLLWRIDETVALEAGVQSFTAQDGDTGAQAFAGLWLRF